MDQHAVHLVVLADTLDYLQYKPAPYSGFDLFNHMADVVTARGRVQAAEAFEQLEKDLAEAVKTGTPRCCCRGCQS